MLHQLTRLWTASSGAHVNEAISKVKKGNDKAAQETNDSAGLTNFFDSKLYMPLYVAGTFIGALAIIKYNTIIHPFTLADNRHYMFYVFRYTIRRSNLIRYTLVVPYVFSQWLVWGTLSGSFTWLANGCMQPSPSASKYINHPFTGSQTASSKSGLNPSSRQRKAVANKSTGVDSNPSCESVSTSTAIIWLLATALSLITAPLVEPRYFIIPWVTWRLLIPSWNIQRTLPSLWSDTTDASTTSGKGDGQSAQRLILQQFGTYDLRLILETAWFVVVNVATMYIFLFKPYQWKAEDGSLLDEGRLQRFMW